MWVVRRPRGRHKACFALRPGSPPGPWSRRVRGMRSSIRTETHGLASPVLRRTALPLPSRPTDAGFHAGFFLCFVYPPSSPDHLRVIPCGRFGCRPSAATRRLPTYRPSHFVRVASAVYSIGSLLPVKAICNRAPPPPVREVGKRVSHHSRTAYPKRPAFCSPPDSFRLWR